MTTPEYPDLSKWPEVGTDGYELTDEQRAERRKLAKLDPHTDMFCLNPHVVWDWAADGAATLSVPWSDFRFPVPPGTENGEGCVMFSNAYDEVLRSKEEFDRFAEVMRQHGVIPLSEQEE